MPYQWGAQRTVRDYQFAEVTSAMQKCIRRGDEWNAMYWAVEIEATQPGYLWNRLEIIASEDIGPANSNISVLLMALRSQYEAARKQGLGRRVFVGHAIIAMCRTVKSRIVDDFIIAAYTFPDSLVLPEPRVVPLANRVRFDHDGRYQTLAREGEALEPPVTRDPPTPTSPLSVVRRQPGSLTDRGVEVGRVPGALLQCLDAGDEWGAMYWAIELESVDPVYLWAVLDVFASTDCAPWFGVDANGVQQPDLTLLMAALRPQYLAALKGDRIGRRVFLGHAILALARAEKSRIVDDYSTAAYTNPEHAEIPDVALDLHTQRGRSLRRGLEHFATEGTVIVPEVKLADADAYRDLAYQAMSERRPFRDEHKSTEPRHEASRRPAREPAGQPRLTD